MKPLIQRAALTVMIRAINTHFSISAMSFVGGRAKGLAFVPRRGSRTRVRQEVNVCEAQGAGGCAG